MNEVIVADLNWTKKNIWDFVVYYSFRKTKKQRIIIPLFAVCAVILAAAGVIAYIATEQFSVILMSGMAILVLIIYAVMFLIIMRGMAAKLYEANVETNGMELCFADSGIIVNQGGNPVGIISWDSIGEYSEGNNALYITTDTNTLLLIEHSGIKQGGKEALLSLLAEKRNARLAKE